LPADVTRLLQRYILALLVYYQTSENGTSPWWSCNPPSEFEDDTCAFLEFTRLARMTSPTHQDQKESVGYQVEMNATGKVFCAQERLM
jgi:hypothetical protein